MIVKIGLGVAFAAIGMLAVGWFHNHNLIMDRMDSFVSKGPRFTAQDGQELCERVAELEKHSIGFQRSGIVHPPCRYVPKP